MSPHRVHIPLRTCVACRSTQEKRGLFRIVRSPEGDVSVDSTGKARGRGAYLCRSAMCIERARRRRLLDKHLDAQVPAAVYEELHRLTSDAPAG